MLSLVLVSWLMESFSVTGVVVPGLMESRVISTLGSSSLLVMVISLSVTGEGVLILALHRLLVLLPIWVLMLIL